MFQLHGVDRTEQPRVEGAEATVKLTNWSGRAGRRAACQPPGVLSRRHGFPPELCYAGLGRAFVRRCKGEDGLSHRRTIATTKLSTTALRILARRRERIIKRLKSSRQTQRFLSVVARHGKLPPHIASDDNVTETHPTVSRISCRESEQAAREARPPERRGERAACGDSAARQSQGRSRGPNCVGRWILARLRDRRFFSLAALNEAIYALLVELNARPLRSWGRSRRDLFEVLDRPALTPLPDQPYEYAEWKRLPGQSRLSRRDRQAFLKRPSQPRASGGRGSHHPKDR